MKLIVSQFKLSLAKEHLESLTNPRLLFGPQRISVATPAEPRGEKKKNNFFFVQILGGEKLLKFVEKCR